MEGCGGRCDEAGVPCGPHHTLRSERCVPSPPHSRTSSSFSECSLTSHNVSRLLLGSPSASGFRFHFNDLPTSAAVVDREGSTVAAALNGVYRTKTGVSLNGAAGDSNSNIDVSNDPELGGDMTIILVAKRTSTEGAASTSNCLFDISNGFETNNIQLCASSSDSTKLIFQVWGARRGC